MKGNVPLVLMSRKGVVRHLVVMSHYPYRYGGVKLETGGCLFVTTFSQYNNLKLHTYGWLTFLQTYKQRWYNLLPLSTTVHCIVYMSNAVSSYWLAVTVQGGYQLSSHSSDNTCTTPGRHQQRLSASVPVPVFHYCVQLYRGKRHGSYN